MVRIGNAALMLVAVYKHFTKTEDEPCGWCPIEAVELVDQAISMLEPIPPEELRDDTPPPRPALRVVRGSKQ